MKARFGLLPALTSLAALSALALQPASVHASPATAAAAAPQPSSAVLQVAEQRQRSRQHASRRGDSGDAQVERLNEMSLQRARQGQDSPTPGPDTTSNLNRISEQEAARGRNMGGQAPMPFR